jgi:hypothetical protein
MHALIFPTAIRIETQNSTYVFTSFLSRANTYDRLIGLLDESRQRRLEADEQRRKSKKTLKHQQLRQLKERRDEELNEEAVNFELETSANDDPKRSGMPQQSTTQYSVNFNSSSRLTGESPREQIVEARVELIEKGEFAKPLPDQSLLNMDPAICRPRSNSSPVKWYLGNAQRSDRTDLV